MHNQPFFKKVQICSFWKRPSFCTMRKYTFWENRPSKCTKFRAIWAIILCNIIVVQMWQSLGAFWWKNCAKFSLPRFWKIFFPWLKKSPPIKNRHSNSNQPWFIGIDVATILGYKYPKDAIRDNVDKEDVLKGESTTLSSQKPLLIFDNNRTYVILKRSKFVCLIILIYINPQRTTNPVVLF